MKHNTDVIGPGLLPTPTDGITAQEKYGPAPPEDCLEPPNVYLYHYSARYITAISTGNFIDGVCELDFKVLDYTSYRGLKKAILELSDGYTDISKLHVVSINLINEAYE